MHFIYKQCRIPSLSWLAVIEKGNDDIIVYHRDKVEVSDKWFVSGIWDGDFQEGDFEKCHFACCSGMKISDTQTVVGGGKNSITTAYLRATFFI